MAVAAEHDTMRIGALQTAYLPWLGFFDQIYRCDLFVIYDDLQYTKKDWRNRNRIKTSQGAIWLTVPVTGKGADKKRICDMEIAPEANWARQHWQALNMNYANAPFFSHYKDFFQRLYKSEWKYLVQLNREIIDYLLIRLGIRTPLLYSSESRIEQDYLSWCGGKTDPTERIANLCRRFGARHFLEGSGGKDYLKEDVLDSAGISVEYHRYPHPRYQQRFGGFIPYLSIVDLLFNHGDDSLAILTHGAEGRGNR